MGHEESSLMAQVSQGANILPPPTHAKDGDLGPEGQPILGRTSKQSQDASPAAAKAHPPTGACSAICLAFWVALSLSLVVLLLQSDTSLAPQDTPAGTSLIGLKHAFQLALPRNAAVGSGEWAPHPLANASSASVPTSTAEGALGERPTPTPTPPPPPYSQEQLLSPALEEQGDSKTTAVHCSSAAWEGGRAPEEPLVWVPQPDRYLLAACTFGLSSNRFLCLKRTLIAAALLNRTVVIPEQDMCPLVGGRRKKKQTPLYKLQVQVDLPRLKSCLSGDRGSSRAPWHGAGAITLQNVLGKNGSMTVDQSVLEPFRLERTKGCRLASGVKFPKHTKWGKRYNNLTLSDVAELRNATAGARVLLLGDLFYFDVQGIPVDIKYLPRVAVQGIQEAVQGSQEAVQGIQVAVQGSQEAVQGIQEAVQGSQEAVQGIQEAAQGVQEAPQPTIYDPRGYGPSPCEPLLRPPQDLIDQANDFIAEYTNFHFAALHLRRGEYIYRCRREAASCPTCPIPRCTYFSLEKLADCISTKMKRLGLKSLFVATNAGQVQVQFLKEHLAFQGIALLRLTGVPWKTDTQEYAMTEKIVASQSSVFFHSIFSTFSNHISELREAIGKKSCHDGPPCP